MNFVFVSGNLKKVHYLEMFLGQKVAHHHLDLDEIQSLDPAEVVKHKAKEAYKKLKRPVVVDDTSLKISILGNLPGPFIKFFLAEIGTDGICELIDAYSDRTAQASVTICFYDGKKIVPFNAKTDGLIANKPLGTDGMGWDSIFIPNGQNKTYAEMDDTELLKYSVRNKAVKKLAEFLKANKYQGEL